MRGSAVHGPNTPAPAVIANIQGGGFTFGGCSEPHSGERGAGAALPRDFRGDGVFTVVRELRTDGPEWPGEGIGRLATRKMPCPAGLFCICIDLPRKNVPLRGLSPISGEERPGI